MKKIFTIILLFLVGSNLFAIDTTSDSKYTISGVYSIDLTCYNYDSISHVSFAFNDMVFNTVSTSSWGVSVYTYWWGIRVYFYNSNLTEWCSCYFFHSKDIAEWFLRGYSTLGETESISDSDYNTYYSASAFLDYYVSNISSDFNGSNLDYFLSSSNSIYTTSTYTLGSGGSLSAHVSKDSRDFDGDGFSNFVEISYCGHPTDYTTGQKTATTDTDGDGLPDLFEDIIGTDSKSTTAYYTITHLYNQYYLNAYTSDKKRVNDLLVIYAYMSGITDVSSVTASELETALKATDSDGDCVNNLEEYYLGTNALIQEWYDDEYYTSSILGSGYYLKDTDGDGFSDLFEDKMNLDKDSTEDVYDTSEYYNYVSPNSTSSSSSSSGTSSSGDSSSSSGSSGSSSGDSSSGNIVIDSYGSSYEAVEIPDLADSDSSSDDATVNQLSQVSTNTSNTNTLLTSNLQALNSIGESVSDGTGATVSALSTINSNLNSGVSSIVSAINSTSSSTSVDIDLSTTNDLLESQLSELQSMSETSSTDLDMSSDKYISEHDSFSSFVSDKFGFSKISSAFDGSYSESLPSWQINIPISLIEENYITFEISLDDIQDYFFVQFFRELLYYVLVFLLFFAFIRILTNY